jgi:hypothetical protein
VISPRVVALVRRAILDLVEDTGGELNDEVLTILLNELGHRVARLDVRNEIDWLAGEGLLIVEELEAFKVVRSTVNGRDVANGLLRYEGVSRHKTGE